MTPSRREFLQACAAASSALAFGCTERGSTVRVPGSLIGASSKVGHLLRSGGLPEPSREERVSVMIIGGGIAGLFAARELQRRGVKDLILFELESDTGGNSRFGKNSISAYPWGAHYVPVPNEESVHVRRLLEELDVIEGTDTAGRPRYREEFLCHEPEERLFMHGRWQTGIVPSIGAGEEDRRQVNAFFTFIASLRKMRGRDGKPIFAIPLDLSSEDAEHRALDRESFAGWLDRQGWNSPYLRWYTNYCCRDDFGTTEDRVSAWAGIHYFAARRAFGANVTGSQILTWPEGNGWIVRRVREELRRAVRHNCLVYSLANEGPGVIAKVFHPDSAESIRFRSDFAIYAAPRFTAPYIIRELARARPPYLEKISYAPWVVANVSVRGFGDTASFAWDNVSYHSSSLGYVVSTHQHLARQGPDAVLTWYLPLSEKSPKEEREQALARSLAEWQDIVAMDLRRMHPEIVKSIRRIDVCLWGHGMIRPAPGLIWGAERREMAAPLGRIHFAHSDMSGISIFEEAQFRGIGAADEVSKRLPA